MIIFRGREHPGITKPFDPTASGVHKLVREKLCLFARGHIGLNSLLISMTGRRRHAEALIQLATLTLYIKDGYGIVVSGEISEAFRVSRISLFRYLGERHAMSSRCLQTARRGSEGSSLGNVSELLAQNRSNISHEFRSLPLNGRDLISLFFTLRRLTANAMSRITTIAHDLRNGLGAARLSPDVRKITLTFSRKSDNAGAR